MGNVNMEATQINYRGGASKMNVEEAIKSAIELTPEQKTNINKIPTIEAAVATKTDQTVIAPEFDAESGIYAIGDLVMHDGKLYEFTSAHETAGDWNSEEVTEKTVADEVDSLNSGLIDLTDAVGWGLRKNMLPLTNEVVKNSTDGGSWSGDVYSKSGVTFELQHDDMGAINGILVNGSPSGDNNVQMVIYNGSNITGSKIISTGGTGSTTTWQIVTYSSTWGTQHSIDTELTTSDNVGKFIIVVKAGYTADNVLIKPMIRLSAVADGTFEPYHDIIGKSVNTLLDRVPTPPSTDGTYTLKVTVSSGTPLYSWISGS